MTRPSTPQDESELQQETWELLLEVMSHGERHSLNSDILTPYHTKLLGLITAHLEAAVRSAEDRGIHLGKAMAHELWMWPGLFLDTPGGEAIVDNKPIPKKYARAITNQARRWRDKALEGVENITQEERDWNLRRTPASESDEGGNHE